MQLVEGSTLHAPEVIPLLGRQIMAAALENGQSSFKSNHSYFPKTRQSHSSSRTRAWIACRNSC